MTWEFDGNNILDTPGNERSSYGLGEQRLTAHTPLRMMLPWNRPDNALLVAVFKYFADESYRDDVFALGGYLAHLDQWSRFEGEWAIRLKQAGIQTFHATDFNNARGEFKGWDTKKRIKFSKYFTAIAESNTELAIGRAVELSAFREILAPTLAEILWTPHGRFTPFMWCARLCLESLVVNWGHFLHNEPLEVIFEEGDGVGEAIDYFRGLKRRGSSSSWASRITAFGDGPKSLLPLQAADLVSHEAMRAITEMLRPSGRPPRKSMLRLTRTDRLELKIFTREQLPNVALQIEQQASPYERRIAPVVKRRRSRATRLWTRLLRTWRRLLRALGLRTD